MWPPAEIHVFYSLFSVELHQPWHCEIKVSSNSVSSMNDGKLPCFHQTLSVLPVSTKKKSLRTVKFSFGKKTEVVFVGDVAIFCHIPNLFSIRRVYCCNSWYCLVCNAANYPVWHQTFPTCNYPGTVEKKKWQKRSLFLLGSCIHSDINGTLNSIRKKIWYIWNILNMNTDTLLLLLVDML